jgi:hypothetical protein
VSCVPASNSFTNIDYLISVGTQQTQQLSGSHYLVDPSTNANVPWKLIPAPETTSKVLQVEGANTSNGVGSFVLYQRPDGIGCTQEVIDTSGQWNQPFANIRILTASIGTARNMNASVNPEK